MNYVGLHDRIIARAKARDILVGYTEQHHIVPRSSGGTNSPANLVLLTAKEHFIIHWLLFKIYKSPALARAFRLMADDQGKLRGRGYAEAKAIYAASMQGENNVSKRADVRASISLGLVGTHAFKGKKRPQHAEKMRKLGRWSGANNLWFGTGDRQVGAANHMARRVVGSHPMGVAMEWDTLQEASEVIGVSIQAVCQALKKKHRSKGWSLEYAA